MTTLNLSKSVPNMDSSVLENLLATLSLIVIRFQHIHTPSFLSSFPTSSGIAEFGNSASTASKGDGSRPRRLSERGAAKTVEAKEIVARNMVNFILMFCFDVLL